MPVPVGGLITHVIVHEWQLVDRASAENLTRGWQWHIEESKLPFFYRESGLHNVPWPPETHKRIDCHGSLEIMLDKPDNNHLWFPRTYVTLVPEIYLVDSIPGYAKIENLYIVTQ